MIGYWREGIASSVPVDRKLGEIERIIIISTDELEMREQPFCLL